VIDARVHAEDEDQALMLDSEDPFAYAQFAQRLGQMEDVLLVDPYFRPPQLIELASGGSVRRILIGMNLRDAELLPLSLALRGLPSVKEIRRTGEVHDRFLIPPSGDLWHLGASVNASGRRSA
jgi:hypothetical protein